MKRVPYEVHLSEALIARIRTISVETGITENAFVEAAIYERTLHAERFPVVRDALTRDEESHPHQCHCGRRFRLAAHLANHQKTHGDVQVSNPGAGAVSAGIADQIIEDARTAHADERNRALETFTLGVDPELVEVDGLVGPASGRAQPDEPKIQDFREDVPEL